MQPQFRTVQKQSLGKEVAGARSNGAEIHALALRRGWCTHASNWFSSIMVILTGFTVIDQSNPKRCFSGTYICKVGGSIRITVQ